MHEDDIDPVGEPLHLPFEVGGQLANIGDGKLLDVILVETLRFQWVEVAYAAPDDMTHRQGFDQTRRPANVVQRVSGSDRYRHAAEHSRQRGFRRVEITVRVDEDQSDPALVAVRIVFEP